MKFEATVTDVLRHFADYINRVAYRGESFVLLRGGKPIAHLSPVPSGGRLGDLPALLASLPRLTENDAREFADDLAFIARRTGGGGHVARRSWRRSSIVSRSSRLTFLPPGCTPSYGRSLRRPAN